MLYLWRNSGNRAFICPQFVLRTLHAHDLVHGGGHELVRVLAHAHSVFMSKSVQYLLTAVSILLLVPTGVTVSKSIPCLFHTHSHCRLPCPCPWFWPWPGPMPGPSSYSLHYCTVHREIYGGFASEIEPVVVLPRLYIELL
jgi:hypothetical protein